MVSPSSISKEVSVRLDTVPLPTATINPTQNTDASSDTNSVSTEESPEVDTSSEKGLHSITSSRSRKFGVIMNPAVLSIISHFPNKCIPRRSEKYVVNGFPIIPPPNSLSEKGSDLKSNINNNNSPDKSQSQSAGKKRSPSSSKLKRYAGFLLAILSAMMFSITGLIVKVINHHHPLTQATWMFVGSAIVAIPLNLLKYVYTYHNPSSNEDSSEDSQEKEKQNKSGTFKPFPDNIEPIHVIETPEGDASKKLPQQGTNVTSIVISEKLQIGISASMPAVIDLNSPPPPSASNRAAQRQQAKRRRQLKLFILLLIRACSGCSGMILYFYSLKYLNVGDSLVIVCSSPIFVFIIGYLFLGESCGVIPVLTILMSMAGVVVITRPPMLTGKESFETDDMIGAGLAFSSMLCIAMTVILMRFLQNVYHGLINLVFGIWGTIQTTTLALAVGVLECPHDLQDAVLMSATGVLFFLGQTFLAVALQYEEAGPVSLVRTSEIVFAFIWQFIFLQVAPDWFSISGAGLILAGIFLTISRKWIAALPESSPSRKMFSFLLR